MKVLFDTRLYVYDNELRHLASRSSLYIMERPDMNDVGGISNAISVPVRLGGHSLERFLSKFGLQLTLPTYIKGYRNILKKIEPDVLVVNDFFRLSSLQALLYKRQHPGLRLILISETKNWPSRTFARMFMRMMLALWKKQTRFFDEVIVYTLTGQKFFLQNAPEIKTVVVPPTVDTEVFRPVSGREYVPCELLRIIINARYYLYKRHVILLQALAELKLSGNRFLLTCVSRDEAGKDSLVNDIKKYGLQKEVHFLPPITKKELVVLMGHHDVLVLPSHNEAIGMVVPEAMACGLPTITSDTVGANVYVTENETGFIFETDNVDQLVESLLRCYDKESLQEMGAKAECAIKNHYAATKHCHRLTDLIL